MHWLDPDYLPSTHGVVKRFLLNLKGEADGLILADGTEVHFPPHMSADVLRAIVPGDAVTVSGVRPRGADVIAAVAIGAPSGSRIEDRGPAEENGERHKSSEKPDSRPIEYHGVIVSLLHGPKGEVRGILFEDGVTVRFSKKHVPLLTDLLKPGLSIILRGGEITSAIGTVIEAFEIGTSIEALKPVKSKKPKHAEHAGGVPEAPETSAA